MREVTMSEQVMSKEAGFVKLLNEFLSVEGNKFVNLTYRNKQGELSKYNIMVGALLKNSYLKDINKVKKFKATTPAEKEAKSELLASMMKSVETNFQGNPNYTKKDYYEHINRNVKMHEGNFYLNSFVLSKQVIEPVEYKKVNSSEKTIAKNKIRKTLRQSKFREFKLELDNIQSASLNGKKFEIISL